MSQSAASTLEGVFGGFAGKTALVTGGATGIGYGIVELLAKLGAKVLFCSRRQTSVDDAIKRLEDQGFTAQGFAADVTSAEHRAVILKKIGETAEHLDVLVHNAGMAAYGSTQEFPLEDFRRVVQLNMEAVFALTQAAYTLLKAADRAAIIMISSGASGQLATQSCPAYPMSKAAMDQFTHYLAVEWAKDGITCNSIRPGLVYTDLTKGFIDSPAGPSALARVPQKQFQTVEDIAALAAFLASPAARHLTGQCIAVDGGFSSYGVWNDA